jgi:hypothetical protein
LNKSKTTNEKNIKHAAEANIILHVCPVLIAFISTHKVKKANTELYIRAIPFFFITVIFTN